MTGPRLHTFLQTAFRWGILATLCIAPTQWSFQPRPKLHLSPADLTLALAAAAWFLDLLLSRDWRRLRPPHWTQALFVALAAVSALTATNKAAALKDLIQYTEYFLVGALLFEAFLRGDTRAARHAMILLASVTALILGLALTQYFAPDADPLSVRGTFGNRNVLGGYLALALPLVFAGVLGIRNALLKAALALLLLAGLTVNLSGASYLAVAGVIACMAATRGPALFIPVAAALLVWQAAVLKHLPCENDLAHFQSLALYDGNGDVNRRYPDWQAAYSMALTHPWLGVGLGNYQKHVGQYYDNIPRKTGPSEPDIQNLYLVLAASAGLPALAAFLALLATAAGRAGIAASRNRSALALGVSGSLCAFALTAVWHPLLVRGIGLPLVFALALARHLAQPEASDGT
ncbi:MAG: O-antigen ligase family protein [Kiritimatiellae bacterium]|nr:O-antigen ligase family protein [Kiritimatiellia bacterium]